VDTLGAGDVFHGAFALALAGKQELAAAVRFATTAASLKCTRLGGSMAAPMRSEVQAALAAENCSSARTVRGASNSP
jgi:sulfofructose kinase